MECLPSLLLLSVAWSGVAQRGCSPPSDAAAEEADCDGAAEQRWYWDKTWFLCLATTSACSTDQRADLYASAKDCLKRCRPMDGKDCPGPVEASVPTLRNEDCSVTDNDGCEADTVCVKSFFASCCPKTQLEAVRGLFEDACPGGAAAASDKTLAATSPVGLLCSSGYEATKVNDFFYRCCESAEAEGGGGDGPSEESPSTEARERDFRRLAGEMRLRWRRQWAPYKTACMDAYPLCDRWSRNYQGQLVKISGRGIGRLELDICDWHEHVRAACPLSCGLCTNRRPRNPFHFYPLPTVLVVPGLKR